MNVPTDFNARDEQGQFLVLWDWMTAPLMIGKRLTLVDSEGNQCSGDCVATKGGLLYVKPDWDTWRPHEGEGAGA